jgi:hypothetical protein
MRITHLLALAVFAATARGAVATGPEAGSAAPDFSASDQSGQTRTLKSVMGPKGAMLVFYRSADW